MIHKLIVPVDGTERGTYEERMEIVGFDGFGGFDGGTDRL